MTRTEVECVLLAGAPADEELRARYGVAWRAEAPVAGKRMVDWVIEALRASGCISRIILVGAMEADADQRVEPGESFLDNVMAGVAATSDTGLIMLAGSDIPLATGEAFADIVREGLIAGADFVYPVIRKEDCDAKYPEFKRTCARVKEGTFTGGNVILIDRDFALRSRNRIGALYAARKKPLKLAAMIGFTTLVRVIVAQKVWPGAMDIRALEQAAGRIMGGHLKGLVTPWPEIGEDLDHPEDFEAATAILERNRAGSADSVVGLNKES